MKARPSAPASGIKPDDMKAMVIEALRALPAGMCRECVTISISISHKRQIEVRAEYGIITPFDVAWREIKKGA